MSRLLSICIPTYNRVGRLAKLLGRIAREIEAAGEEVAVLVSDNASDDGTEDLLSFAAVAHPWLTVHRQPENLGATANIRWLMEHAPETDYVWGFGDDDLMMEGSLRKVLKLLRDERPAWLHLPHVFVNGDGTTAGSSPAPGAVRRYATAGEMWRAQHQWLTFMSASVASREGILEAARAIPTRNAYFPLLWLFRAGLDGPCVIAGEHLVQGSTEISWADRSHRILTLDFTSLYDDGLHAGLSPEDFGASLDGLYADGFGFGQWTQVPIERLAGVVDCFPQSSALRDYLWRIARSKGCREVLPTLDAAARVIGADIEADELVRLGEAAFSAGDATGALELFARATRRMPTNLHAWNDLVVVAHSLGMPDVHEPVESALFVDPDDGTARVNRAAVRLQAGDRAGAHADLAHVLERDPEDRDAGRLMALAFPQSAGADTQDQTPAEPAAARGG